MTIKITRDIQEHFFPGMNFEEIRDKLQQMGLDRHMPIELRSTEIAVLTPKGILLQERKSDNGQLGMWEGVLEDGETPEQGAVRELREEAGIIVTPQQLIFDSRDCHEQTYANDDQVIFEAYRFLLQLPYVPSGDGVLVKNGILFHQRDFINNLVQEFYHHQC